MDAYEYEPLDPVRAPDYWVIRGPWGLVLVTPEVALYVLNQWQRRLPPRWIEFYDLAGSHVVLRTRTIEMIVECTAEQRAWDRRLAQLVEEEKYDPAPYRNYRIA